MKIGQLIGDLPDLFRLPDGDAVGKRNGFDLRWR
jgi:hypothetical protein